VSLWKVKNSTIKELNNSEVDEISKDKFKRTMIRMTNKIKKDLHKHMNEFMEDTNKQQDVEEESNKDIEIQKKKSS
jgi:1,2-phenylacetyl-CoA epoxidase PaaB subunit